MLLLLLFYYSRNSANESSRKIIITRKNLGLNSNTNQRPSSKSVLMEVRFVTAMTRGFFLRFVTIAASPLNFRRKQQKKKTSGTQGRSTCYSFKNCVALLPWFRRRLCLVQSRNRLSRSRRLVEFSVSQWLKLTQFHLFTPLFDWKKHLWDGKTCKKYKKRAFRL